MVYLSVSRLVILPALIHMKEGTGGGGEGLGGEGRTDSGHLEGAGPAIQRCSQLGAAGNFTPPPPPARAASFGFEVLWLRIWVAGNKSSSLGILLFTSRRLCSYFGRNESHKGKFKRPPHSPREGGDFTPFCLMTHVGVKQKWGYLHLVL